MANQQQQRTAPAAAQVQKFLGDIDYPAVKQNLLDAAQGNGADKGVINALNQIPDREYENPVDVSGEVSKLHEALLGQWSG